MKKRMTNRVFGAALTVSVMCVGTAVAGPFDVINPVGPPTNASGISATQYNAVAFSLTAGFNNLDIDASLVHTTAQQGGSGTAYLTNMIGAGTTIANVIAQTTFDFQLVDNASTDVGWVDLFSGLSLGAGDYFLIFAAPFGQTGDSGFISLSPNATYDTHPDASVGDMLFTTTANMFAFAPASAWSTSGLGNRFIRISSIPAPGALALLGLAGVVGTRRRRN